ncbi:MAG: aspartate aminotransferase family protein, partial [Acetobacteraceae bacterium]
MTARVAFPARGRPEAEIFDLLDRMREHDADWRAGRVPLYVFGALPEIEEIGRRAYMAYFTENALGARRAFRSLGRMEAEIEDMALDLFHA